MIYRRLMWKSILFSILCIYCASAFEAPIGFSDSVTVSVTRVTNPCPNKCNQQTFLENGTLKEGLCVYQKQTLCQFACSPTQGCVCRLAGEASPNTEECCSGIVIDRFCADSSSQFYSFQPKAFDEVLAFNSYLNKKISFTNNYEAPVWVKLATKQDLSNVILAQEPIKVAPKETKQLEFSFKSGSINAAGNLFLIVYANGQTISEKIPYKLNVLSCIPNGKPATTPNDCCEAFKNGICAPQQERSLRWIYIPIAIIVIFVAFVIIRVRWNA